MLVASLIEMFVVLERQFHRTKHQSSVSVLFTQHIYLISTCTNVFKDAQLIQSEMCC